jgi:pimeloyl-ACP methyl ester carboxylesterase
MTEASRPRRILRRIGLVLAGLFGVLLLLIIILSVSFERALNQTNVDATQKTATSKDGTTIAYEQSGSGPLVILVPAALSDRSGTSGLARYLSAHFTVINYDRRGRGRSTDTQPYAVEREVEDIEALIDSGGHSAFVFGSSSGAVLALEAGNKLDGKVKKLFLYEPPFIVDDSRAPIPDSLSQESAQLVSAGHRNDAVKLFFTGAIGIPNLAVNLMRYLMPGWSKMAGMAHTIPYDLAVLAGTQTGKPLPANRWTSVTAPILVVVGSKSEPFFRSGANALTEIVPNAKYRPLEGGSHASVLMAPQSIANAAEPFFSGEEK